MIKLPTVEYMMKLIKKHFGQENNPAFISDLNAEILRLNEPQMPEFPEWAGYAAKDPDLKWYWYQNIPVFELGEWLYVGSTIKACPVDGHSTKLWLEHINGNRPPQDSLICLEDYKC